MSTDATQPQEDDVRRGGLFSAIETWIAAWGRSVIDSVIAVGDLGLFVWRTFSWLFTRLPRRETLMPCFYQVGVLTLPVVALTGTFFGMIMAVNAYFQLNAIGLESRLGSLINMSLVRELGPVLAGVMLAGRVGSSIAAELGTMRVTEQIDALSSMGANPIHYLVVPRFLACLVLIPALTVVADFMGVLGGYFYSIYVFEIDHHYYWYNAQQFVGTYDLFVGLIKSVFFGSAIAMVSCYRGFHCAPGAEGVGRAATIAFVQSFVLIILLDLMVGILLDAIYFSIWPGGAKLI